MNEERIIQQLNEAQHQAVSAPLSNMLVLAGAGSGKTRVLVHRIAWLVEHFHVSPMSILAVTFTNKASHEMRARIEGLLGFSVRGMWVGTFHNLAHRLLRAHWKDADLPETFQIIDSDDQLRLIKRIIRSLNLDEEKWPAKQAQWFINNKKDDGLRAKHLNADNDPSTAMFIRIYEIYEDTCQRGGLVDFAEILLRSHELWLKRPEILKHYQTRFSHILVDEFQDTNSIQYAWLRMLVGDNGTIMAVGDDDQSIYSWRGAQVDNIHRFADELPHVTLIRLEQNYRSTQRILSAANALIRHNANRMGKELWTEDSEGEHIGLYGAYNEIDEAHFIADQIRQAQHRGARLNDIAVLYRSNAQSRVIEEALIRSGTPYRIYGGLRFYERAEIKDVLAYLRLLTNVDDDASFERIYNLPTRGIGARSFAVVREIALGQRISLWKASEQVGESGELPARAAGAISQFLALIDSLRTLTSGLPLDQQIHMIIEHASLIEHYQKERGEKGRARVENLRELVTAAKQFEGENTDEEMPLVSAFLTHAALEAGDNQAHDYEDSVKLMTLHTAKGLEFETVIMAGLEEGLFPHQMSMEEPGRLEEERRLCYVGMTRAMKKLIMCYAESRRLYGREMRCVRSRFLHEVPDQFFHHLSVKTQTRPAPTIKAPNLREKSGTVHEGSGLTIGQTVHHKKFGEGVLLAVEGMGERLRAEVQFSSGKKWILAEKIQSH